MQNSNYIPLHFDVIEFRSVAFLYEAIQSPSYRIIYLVNGKLFMEMGGEKTQIESNQCMVISQIEKLDLSTDAAIQGFAVIFSNDFLLNTISLKSSSGYLDFFVQNSYTKIVIDKEDLRSFKKIWKLLMQIHISTYKYFQTEMLHHHFNLLFYYLSEAYLRKHKYQRPKHQSAKTKLVIDFYRKLEGNFIEKRKAVFYARELFVSAVHLNRIVKEITGKTIKEILDEHMIWEAKKLLENNELNITEIADELQFSSLSSFCVFFKKHTGWTPVEFRENLK